MYPRILQVLLLTVFLSPTWADWFSGLFGFSRRGTEAQTSERVQTDGGTAVERVAPPEYLRTERRPGEVVYRWVHNSVSRIQDGKVRVGAGVNLRTIPLSGTQERPVRNGTARQFKVLGTSDDFYKIDVTAEFTDLSVAKFRIATVATQGGTLALRPSLNSSSRSVRTWMPQGVRVQVLETQGNWARVRYDNQAGYASLKFMQFTGEQEEYWHRQVDSDTGRKLMELKSLAAIVSSTGTVPSTAILRYVTLLNETLPDLELHELSSAILEMETQLGVLIARESGGSAEDARLAQEAKTFRDQKFFNIDAEQEQATKLLSEGKLDQALKFAQIGAYKTRYSQPANLTLLKSILERKLEAEQTESLKVNLREQIAFVERTIAATPQPEPPQVDFSTPGEEGVVSSGMPDQAEIDRLIADARRLNTEGKYDEAMQIGMQLLERTEGKSVKVKAFLATQLREMAAMPQYAEQAEGFRQRSSVYLEEARAGMTENLTEYPDNREWSDRLAQLSPQGPSEMLEPTETEETIDRIIYDVLDKNRQQHYTRGKDRLEELDGQHQQKSAKVKVHLAEQYLLLARSYPSRAQAHRQKANEALEKAIALKGQHLQTYTENSLWADRATARQREIATGTITPEGTDSGTDPDGAQTTSEPVAAGDKHIQISGFDMNVLTTLTILEAGHLCPQQRQERLDVAHVVFNRINSALFNQNTVSAVAFASGQFEPFFTILGRGNSSRRQRIFSSQAEAAAFATSRQRGLSRSMATSRLNEVRSDLQDEGKMRTSRDFVAGRTFFLGSTMSFVPDRGDIRRARHCNHFKIGIANSDVRRHRPHMQTLVNRAPLKVTTR